MIFTDGILDLSALPPDERVRRVLQEGCDRAESLVRPGDLLAAALSVKEGPLLSVLSGALSEGTTVDHLAAVLEIYRPRRKTASDFDGSRDRFSGESLAALAEFENHVQQPGANAANVALELLVAALLSNLDSEDKEYLTSLDPALGARLLLEHVRASTEAPAELFDAQTERLRSEVCTEEARVVLEAAGKWAGEMGLDRILAPQVFLALLAETGGLTEQVVRRRLRPDLSPTRLLQLTVETFARAKRHLPVLAPNRAAFGGDGHTLLGQARELARLSGCPAFGPAHLLGALLASPPPRLASFLEGPSVGLRLRQLREDVERHLRPGVQPEPRFVLPPDSLPSEDLTWCAREGTLPKALHLDGCIDAMKKGLFRRSLPHVVLTGLRGVGKTTAVRELARQAASGEIDFLRRKRFLWVNAADVAPEISRQKLDLVLHHVAGRSDVVLCLDGIEALLRGESGRNHKLRLRAALKEAGWQLIGVLSDTAFEDLFTGDHELMECCTRVSLLEPEPAAAVAMAHEAAHELAGDFKVRIDRKVVERAVSLSADYILNERLPTKAIKLLRRACEDLSYARSQMGSTREEVVTSDILHAISLLTGVPESTLAGEGERVDYERGLGEWVVGQEEAVRAVAAELQLIKAGLSHAGKPASVMFFAGLTGCGKTELAKALARFYSTSKRLQTITMGNYTEPHSVSGIIGVPPGYVGHEQGGRLINDLNSDPYCVFLLDEAEKAHPDVWKPFLNLFDEGWVVDQRGVKAFAERAIFILTSNAGHEVIAAQSRAGTPPDQIVHAVKQHLVELRRERTSERIFTPEFLARIGRIIVFRPLDLAAMEGICRKMIAQLRAFWKERREQTLHVPEELILDIARAGHLENKRSDGKEGGRILTKLIRTRVEEVLRRGWAEQETEAKRHNVVELVIEGDQVRVRFSTQPIRTPAASQAWALEQLRSAMDSLAEAGPGALRNRMAEVLAGLEDDLLAWQRQQPAGALDPSAASATTLDASLRSLLETLTRALSEAELSARARLEQLLASAPTRHAEAAP
jgi:ATP-dependent Clp protease ATP-binding subunit ClpC